jgi:hypothetical protein
MALLTPTVPAAAGSALVYTTVSASDTFYNDGHAMLHVKNADVANALTVTVTSQVLAAGDTRGWINKTFTVPANSDRLLPALSKERFNAAGTDLVTVGFTKTGGVADVTAAVIRDS